MTDKHTKAPQGSDHKTRQIIVFKLGQEEYGLNIDQIKEVVLTPTITRVPQSQSFIKGVANIRGNVIAMLDLAEKFGLHQPGDQEQNTNHFTLVIESDDYKMGILVRDVPNTLTISTDKIEDSFFAGAQADQSYITGIVKLDKRLIIMIDIFKVVNEREAQLFRNSALVNSEQP